MADSRIGLRCVELPEILGWAQAAELTTAPNPYYQEAELNASSYVAEILLNRLGVSTTDALHLGEEIMRGINQLSQDAAEGVAVNAAS